MFDAYVRDNAHWSPRAPAVITPARVLSYAEFNADIDRFAAALAALGISREFGVVSVCLDSAYLTLAVTAALARLRVVSSPYNDHGAALRLVEEREAAGSEAPGPRLVTLTRDWLAAVRAAEPRPYPVLEVDYEQIGRVMLSSGTTRMARRVAMTWRRIELGNHGNIRTYAAGAQGVWVPLTTVESMLGFTMSIAAWSLGNAVAGGLGVAELPALMEAWPAGVIGCTPAQLRALLAALPPGFLPRPAWRVATGGSLLPVPLAREVSLSVTPDVRIIYGATESSINAVGLAAHLEDAPGQVGVTPGGGVMEILDDDGRPVPEGESGEIRIKSERMTPYYLDDPEGTAERFRDGWFYSKDVGRRLPDGRVVLEGRVDDRMNLGGVKFMPAVLEEAAFACPGVRDAAAFAVPGSSGLDVCWLAVVAGPAFDRSKLAPHLAQYPKLPPPRFAWVDEIPRNAMGKVERGKLRDALLAATGTAS
ncbi:MAG TPA: class I adenylate-forming enzyme family protein [Phenylobacterium sp.]